MVNYIDISIDNINLRVYKEYVLYNDKEILIDEIRFDELLRIIRFWKHNYISNKIVDGERFVVEVSYNNNYERYEGVGEYPDNYIYLKEWIGDVCGL